MTEMQFGKAINLALADALDADDNVVLMGEDIGQLGGVFRVTDGLQDRFGEDRVMDSPLAESGIVGTAVGMTFAGMRPVVEIQFDGFIYPAFDQIVTQVAKLHYRTQGTHRVPMTIRVPYGGHIGSVEHHSESPEAYFAHTAGLKVVTASSPQEAYSTLRAAIESDDPVLFFEPKAKYWSKGEVDTSIQRDLHSAVVLQEGRDVTLATYGPTIELAMKAAVAASDEGIEIEVIDLRSISPLDVPTVAKSVEKTGRLVVAHESQLECGIGAELVSSIVETSFGYLEAAPERVGGYDLPYPPAQWEGQFLPSLDRVLDAVDRTLGRRNSRDASAGTKQGGAAA
ncbi:MAG TPA: alpha-ketoacid dehydrogenase subunit beta [Candidatus Agrococcus pullicola]|uniref:3-methyl-2-oxobutanoate dehydrogenase (2-methylpropanoyl-transferring) n=1 Tax=Candidatus Agrococcus pullicola TaxID=2838429 RepID=A0A9D1YT05_9MICO|nr:alpha-ketoacid dehydrogenase subunit beta [Candidatus Agrococcus pullicola]